MRQIVPITLLLLLVACASIEDTAREQPAARLFIAMHDGAVRYEQIDSEDLTAVRDAIAAECPAAGDGSARAALIGDGGSLVQYIEDDTVVCAIFKPAQPREIVYAPRTDAPAEGVAATVNGEAIMLAQVEAQLAAQGGQTDEAAVGRALTTLINDALLRAAASDVEVDEEALAASKVRILTQAGIDEAQLADALAQRGLTQEQFDAQVAAEARMDGLLQERLLLGEVAVTEEDLEAYYLSNTQQFLQSEQALMRHILIGSADRGEARAMERAQMVAGFVPKQDFCELVREYSDDEKSKDSCGTYVIPRGVIDPNLEQAGFSTPPNATVLVRTDDGFHLVQTLQVTPTQVVPYPQVASQLRDAMTNSVFRERLSMYLLVLRADAEISVYLS